MTLTFDLENSPKVKLYNREIEFGQNFQLVYFAVDYIKFEVWRKYALPECKRLVRVCVSDSPLAVWRVL